MLSRILGISMNRQSMRSADQALANLENLLPDLAANRLRAADYEVTTGVGKNGVVGLLRNGAGSTVMQRPDVGSSAAPIPARMRTPRPKANSTRSRATAVRSSHP